MPRILRIAAGALALTLLAPAAATADRWSVQDEAGDVSGTRWSPEPDPCGTVEEIDATEETHTDLTGVSVRHSRRMMTVTTRFRGLDPFYGIDLVINIRSSTGGWWLDLTRYLDGRGWWKSRAFLGREPKFPDPDDLGECEGYGVVIVGEGCRIERDVDFARDLVRLGVPRRCLDNPRWVRVAVSTHRSVASDEPEDPAYELYSDEWDGGVELSEWMPPFGPRVRAAAGATTKPPSGDHDGLLRQHRIIPRR